MGVAYNAPMERHLFRTLVLGAAFALLGSAIASAATTDTPSTVAQATPAPKATTAPSPFTYSGYLRAYYFTRTNPKPPDSGAAPNQASFNPAIDLHGAYDFGGGFSIGGTYLYANPFNGCEDPASHTHLPCGAHKIVPAGYPQQNNPDDTLPGYRMSTLYEAYLQYKDANLFGRLGDQVINTPWANSSDSRLKPAAFRAADFSYKIDKAWSIEGMYSNRWEDRVQSDFVDSTLITQNGAYPDAPGTGNTGIPHGGVASNNGFYYGKLSYAGPISANLYYYHFDQIANMLWADAKYGWKSWGKPYIALQGGSETNTGNSLAGKIDSQVIGAQVGFSPFENVDLSLSTDYIPSKNESITLPAGATCSMKPGSVHEITGTLMYWLPGGGTPNCVPGAAPGTATVYYGGWASPYTDSYATDPLFTTSISQGMADRRSTGGGVKLAGTFFTDRKQVRFIVSHAWYTYGTAEVGLSPTQETDIDGTYFFSKVGKGPYHGWSLRHRYAERTQAYTTGVYGGANVFKYNRTQLEYDF